MLALLTMAGIGLQPVQAELPMEDNATPYLQVFIGQYDLARPQADSQYGLEYHFAQHWTRFNLTPTLGITRTRYGSHLVSGGVERRTAVLASGAGPALNVGFAAGFYHHGGNADTDLGFPLQFRSSVGIDHQFPDRTRLGLFFSHISNASLADENPGTELVTVRYGLTF